MARLPEISDELLQLVFMALDHGIDALVDEADLLTPFVFIVRQEQRSLHRFADDDMGAALNQAKAFIHDLGSDADQYALVFDGLVQVGAESVDAIIVEAGEAGQEVGHVFAQRYVPATLDSPLQTIGKAGYLYEGNQYLRQG
jgi:hypothetical protein